MGDYSFQPAALFQGSQLLGSPFIRPIDPSQEGSSAGIDLTPNLRTIKLVNVVNEAIKKGQTTSDATTYQTFERPLLEELHTLGVREKKVLAIRTAELYQPLDGEGQSAVDSFMRPGLKATINPNTLEFVEKFIRENGISGIEPSNFDTAQPVIDLVRRAGVDLHLSLANMRFVEGDRFKDIGVIARQVPVVVQGDEPAEVRGALKGVTIDTTAPMVFDRQPKPFAHHTIMKTLLALRLKRSLLQR